MSRSFFALLLIAVVGAQNIACIALHCTPKMAACGADTECAKGLACIIGCGKIKNDTDAYNTCTIRCNYGYSDDAFVGLISCMADNLCLPAIQDKCPPNPQTVKEISYPDLAGRWYISLGLNPAIDCYACQIHYFTPTADSLFVVENFQLPPGYDVLDAQFNQTYTRVAGEGPGVLTAYEKYQNDTNYWYIAGKSDTLNGADDWFIVFYCGDNVGWHNYHGVLVYTRSPTLPVSQQSAVKAVLAANNVDIAKLCVGDNLTGCDKSKFGGVTMQDKK